MPVLVISLLVLAAMFALQCPELGCTVCSTDEVAARQGGASSHASMAAVVPLTIVASLPSAVPLRNVAIPVAVAEHPALVMRLQV
jgi:predicted secreted protein